MKKNYANAAVIGFIAALQSMVVGVIYTVMCDPPKWAAIGLTLGVFHVVFWGIRVTESVESDDAR